MISNNNIIIGHYSGRGISSGTGNVILGGRLGGLSNPSNTFSVSDNSQIYKISVDANGNSVLGGNGTFTLNGTNNAIVAGTNNAIAASVDRAVVIGGSNITASVDDTVYVPNLDVSGSSIFKNNVVISGSLTVTDSSTLQSTIITGSLRGNVSALSISSNTASLDCSTGNFFTLLLVSGSDTFVNPSNINPGQTINLRVKQASVASGSISFASSVLQVSGSTYTPTATANGEDIVTFISFDSTNLYLSNIKNFV